MSTYDPIKTFSNFRADDLARDCFENNEKDPFNRRLRNIRSWEDVRYEGGFSRYQCNPQLLREGYMSQVVHDFLEKKLGKERLGKYFGPAPKPKQSKSDEELEELAIRLFGSVSEVNALNARKHR